MPQATIRGFTARVDDDVRRVVDQPFVIAYQRPTGVDPSEAVKYDIIGDASPAEMVRMASAIAVMLDGFGLWDKVAMEMKEYRANRGPMRVESPVERTVQQTFPLTPNTAQSDESAVA